MDITKYEHACFTVSKDDQVLVVDPGNLTTDFVSPEHVVAVVVTHEHGDHFDHDQLAAIIDKNPEALIIGPEAVTKQIEVFETRSVAAGDSVKVGPFELKFFGENHAQVHPSIPLVRNVGVLIDDLLYYPGDSLVVPEAEVDILAIPADAPWLKVSEAMDFLAAVKPRVAFPTHDGFLNSNGKAIVARLIGTYGQQFGSAYRDIDGQSVEL